MFFRASAAAPKGGLLIRGVVLTCRRLTFSAPGGGLQEATGFWINGRNVKLKGVALHQDGGAVGVAVPLAVWAQRLDRLRTLGVNAIRTAHNPPDPAFLDLCDRMGFLVMDELFDAWTVGKPSAEKGENLHFTEWGRASARDTIRRDRNHPSIVLYSTGNEIHDTANPTLARNILAGLVGIQVEHPGALVAGIGEQPLQALQLPGVDDGAVVGVVGDARVQTAHGALVGFGEGVEALARNQHIVRGDAGLAGIEAFTESDALGGGFQRHAGGDNGGRLAAQFQGHRGEVGGGGQHDLSAHAGGPGEQQVVERQAREGLADFDLAEHDADQVRREHALEQGLESLPAGR